MISLRQNDLSLIQSQRSQPDFVQSIVMRIQMDVRLSLSKLKIMNYSSKLYIYCYSWRRHHLLEEILRIVTRNTNARIGSYYEPILAFVSLLIFCIVSRILYSVTDTLQCLCFRGTKYLLKL